MKRENRILGLIFCIVLLLMGIVLTYTVQRELGYLLIMFASGFALRETLDRSESE